MRSLLFLLFISFGLTGAFAQKRTFIAVPVLKENNQVDSLLSFILKNNTGAGSNSLFAEGSCMVMRVSMSRDSTFYFGLETAHIKDINQLINRMVINKNPFGYFSFRQARVFVWWKGDVLTFFSKTMQSQSFPFIYKLPAVQPVVPKLQATNMWNFTCRDGVFTPFNIKPKDQLSVDTQ